MVHRVVRFHQDHLVFRLQHLCRTLHDGRHDAVYRTQYHRAERTLAALAFEPDGSRSFGRPFGRARIRNAFRLSAKIPGPEVFCLLSAGGLRVGNFPDATYRDTVEWGRRVPAFRSLRSGSHCEARFPGSFGGTEGNGASDDEGVADALLPQEGPDMSRTPGGSGAQAGLSAFRKRAADTV